MVSWPHILDVWAKHAVNRKVADGRCLFMAGSSKESDTGRARVKIPSRTHTHTHWLFLSAKASRYSFETSQTASAEAQPVNTRASWGGPLNPSYPVIPVLPPRCPVTGLTPLTPQMGREWIWLLLPPMYSTLDPSHYFLGTAFVSVTLSFSSADQLSLAST